MHKRAIKFGKAIFRILRQASRVKDISRLVLDDGQIAIGQNRLPA